jgi:uncharacterized 2Fe-2S/4Fe-4S cluster protein (DUF4445 family)
LKDRIGTDRHGAREVRLTDDGRLSLTQWDVRELQKAKGAIRAAMDTLLAQLDLGPQDLKRIILTGSFGGQIDVESARSLGMIPPAPLEIIETIPNGAGLGAAIFLSDEGFLLGEKLARRAEQIDLDQDPQFMGRYIGAMALTENVQTLDG